MDGMFHLISDIITKVFIKMIFQHCPQEFN